MHSTHTHTHTIRMLLCIKPMIILQPSLISVWTYSVPIETLAGVSQATRAASLLVHAIPSPCVAQSNKLTMLLTSLTVQATLS